MRTRGLATFAALLLGASHAPSARADDVAPALSPPPLAVSLVPGTGGGPWKLRVENTGDVPVRIAADPRLLVLDVTPPAGFVDPTVKTKRPASAKPEEPKTSRCVLPEDARPSTDEGRDLVVPAKRSWSAIVDPLFYCFGPRERAMLVAGATVTAHFGWPAPLTKPGNTAAAARGRKPAVLAPPFVTAPVGAAVGKLAPAKELVGAPVTLSETVPGSTPRPSPSAAADGGAALPPLPSASGSLVVSMPDSLDIGRGNEISTTVTVANEGDKPAVLLFRSDMLRFNVAGPAGSIACGTTRAVDAPIRELSGGLKRRLVIARALLNDPEMVVLDEPTTGLDPQVRHLIWARLRELKAHGVTLLLSTHYMEEAHQLCDRLVVMDHGRILAEGRPRALVAAHLPGHVLELPAESAPATRPAGVTCEVHGDLAYVYSASPELLERLAMATGADYRVRSTTLEDLFLKLTGRDLRESE